MLTEMRPYVCKYGKSWNAGGKCNLQHQCISERKWLMGNLTKCANELTSSGVTTLPPDYLLEAILFEIAKTRTFYSTSGLPHQIEFEGKLLKLDFTAEMKDDLLGIGYLS